MNIEEAFNQRIVAIMEDRESDEIRSSRGLHSREKERLQKLIKQAKERRVQVSMGRWRYDQANAVYHSSVMVPGGYEMSLQAYKKRDLEAKKREASQMMSGAV